MAMVNVKKMSIIALRRNRDRLVELLQRLGKVEIINIREKTPKEEWESVFIPRETSKELMELQGKLADIQFALDFMARYSTSRKSIFAEKPLYREEEMEDLSRSQELWSIIRECREMESRLNGLKSEEMKLNNTIEMLKPWENLDIPIEELKPTDKVNIYSGNLPVSSIEKVKELLREKAPESCLQVVSTDRELAYVLLIYLKSLEEEVSAVLKENSWGKVDLPQLEGIPAEAIVAAEEKIREFDTIRQEIAEKAVKLSESRPQLEVLFDYYNMIINRVDVAGTTGETKETFYLEGWVAEPDIDRIRQAILSKVPEAYIVISDAEEDDDFPVVLDNPKLVEPFEMITELYSPPGRNDIDPNILVAPFFFIFFGMMISDAGYGIILALLGFWALKALKPTGMAKKLFGLVALGGVSTIFWGAMFGGWFGDLIKIPALWMNPLEDPMSLLVFSFILGIVQIYFGLGAAAYRNIRAGKVLDAIYDQGLWFVFLTGLIMFVFPSLAGVAKVLSLAGAIGLVLTQGRSKKNVIGKVTSGVLSLYGVTGYLSDVLSYSRILALGLATGVIGMVINTMAKMLGFNIIGYVLMTVALIVGHVFNIAINALGAYVHSSRLQYVEFFSKFYDGGGRMFNPFRLKTKYTNLLNEEEI
jgi:V/A-type H+-transporting ATPase subunit I